MFFNNCSCCRCRHCCRQENTCCNKTESNPCFDKQDESRYEKCPCKPEKRPCCHLNERDLYEGRFDSQESKTFDNRYENSFSKQNNLGRSEDYSDFYPGKIENQDDKQYTNREFDINNKSYTPSWEDDKCCKHQEKCNKAEFNKCGKPVKYICIPLDKD